LAGGVAGASADEALLSAGAHAGPPVGLFGELSIPQLAALLNTSPNALIEQIEGATGSGLPSSLLSSVLGDPNATLKTLLEGVTAAGGDSGAVTALIDEMLAPAAGTAAGLQGLVGTILSDLAADGRLGPLAEALGVPVSVLEKAIVLPLSDEALAATLGTTVGGLGKLLLDAGAITAPLTPTAPIVSIPGAGGGTTVVAAPSEHGGVTLTTIYAPQAATPAASSVLDAKSSQPVSNAFKIVSIKLNRKGQVVETVSVPHPGRVTVKASARGTAARNGRGKHRAVPVAGVSTSVAAGTRSIVLRPGKAFKKLHSATFALKTTYVPAGGSASTKSTRTTLRH
jgi:hypothetical protein